MSTPEASKSQNHFLRGGGEMGILTRQFDWSKTSLGGPDQWPQSLRSTLNILLNARFPMFLWWGPELIQFYNDAYRPSLGNNGKHPTALGQRGEECWPEIWPVIKPLIDQVLAGGEATWAEDQLIPIYRNGQLEDVYWTFGYSPAYDDSGRIAGVLVVCQETTRQVNAQRRLNLSEERFRRLIEQAPVAVALFSGPQFVITLANEQVLEYWGRTRDQVMEKPLFEALPEASGQGFEELLQGVYTTGEPFIAKELTVTLERNGQLEPTYINFVYEPFYEVDGSISGVLVVCTEITEQVLARQKVEESESRFRSLIEEAPVATGLFVGREMRIELANEVMIHYWGKGWSVIGKPLEEALPELEGQPFLAILDEVFTTGQTYVANSARVELDVNGVLGAYYFDFTYKPLRNAVDEVYAILEMAIDVTEQVLARQQILEAQESLQGAIELAELGTWQIDLSTRILEFSQRLKQWFGIRPDETITVERAYEPIREADRLLIKSAVQSVSTPGNDGTNEVEFTVEADKTGRERILKAQGKACFDSQGEATKISGTVQDVTEQRKLQLALVQQVAERTRELAAANKQLTESNILLTRSNEHLQTFAYVASHDLQEPLRKIQQFGDLLKVRYASSSGEELLYLERMQVAANRMSTLIQDLLNFSRISSQRSRNTSVSLNKVIESVMMDLDVLLAETGALVTVEPLPTVSGDRSQLGQLFQNLLSNALKFRQTQDVPHIFITAQVVSAEDLPATVTPSRNATAYHRIDVRDDGIGFDEKYLDRIFQVFQRLHGRNEFDGTGIGLAICERVATNHGGAITASSQAGQGATFSVFLPQ